MIHVVIGTRAQTIKMAPVLRELADRGVAFTLVLTGQHSLTIAELLSEFGIGASPLVLYDGPEVKSLPRVLPWAARVIGTARRSRGGREMRGAQRHDVHVVHGDTFSTLVGIYLGRRNGSTIAHVESGLRSFNWVNPFPEELVRVLAMRFTDVAFAPGDWAAGNLDCARVRVVNTGANTLLDSVRFACGETASFDSSAGGALVSVHRFETLYSEARLKTVVEFVNHLAGKTHVTFVLHPSTESRLEKSGLLDKLESSPGVHLRPRMTYIPFLQLAAESKLVVTDGGSNQEELSYLGVPTILLRNATERQEGLGSNAMLARFDPAAMREFAERALEGRERTIAELPDVHPSRTIVDELERLTRSGCRGVD